MQSVDGLSYVAFWFGVNGLILLALLMHVTRQRQALNVWAGDGGNSDLIRALRGKAVFLEYAPISLLGLAIMALIDAPFLLVHFLAVLLTAGQLFHAIYILRDDGSEGMRDFGERLSLVALGLCGVCLLALALVALI